MAKPRFSDEDFIELFERYGPARAARMMGLLERGVLGRRARLEKKLGRPIKGPDHHKATRTLLHAHPYRKDIQVENGTVLVGSDAHYWPGHITTAHRAFVQFCRDMKPKVVIKNGDALDGSTISRHPPIGWETRPSLISELEVTKERLDEIRDACKGAQLYWPLGNHDARFETRLATVAPEYAKIHGVHLKDHFPEWFPCWSVWINGNVVVKHRWKNGIHATHNNAVQSGVTMVTGHLHSLKVTPWSDYTGTRYGVDCGTMADPLGPQFADYTEDNPKNWRSGFVVLTFHKGRLLWPEVVHVLDQDHVEFRGQVIKV